MSRAFWASLLVVLISSSSLAESITPSPTSAQQAIERARKSIERNPSSHRPHNALAMALARRARETADPRYYQEADHALETSFRLAADNYEGRRARTWILLGQHEFAQALEEAKALNLRAPDDLFVYGLLVDAHMELGGYDEAETAAQWMLDLRPGTVPALTRGAYVREMIGDIDGAIEWMQEAYEQIDFMQTEDRAWLLTQVARLHLATGDAESADTALQHALELVPRYHYALASLARVRGAQRRFGESVELLRQRYEVAPHPENLYELAEAMTRAGRGHEAEPLYVEFEAKARAEMASVDNANRELVFYYADRAGRYGEALTIASREIQRRRDVFTLDAYAWALHRNGQSAEAHAAIQAALAPGVRNAKFFYHAGVIYSRKNTDEAARYLKRSLNLNPLSEVASAASRAIDGLAEPEENAPPI